MNENPFVAASIAVFVISVVLSMSMTLVPHRNAEVREILCVRQRKAELEVGGMSSLLVHLCDATAMAPAVTTPVLSLLPDSLLRN